jgi:hypothetical protein
MLTSEEGAYTVSSTQDQIPNTSNHNGHLRPNLEPSASTSSTRSRFDRLKTWKTSVAGRRKSGFFTSSSTIKATDPIAGEPYIASGSPPKPSPTHTPSPGRRSEDGYDWEEGSDEDGGEPDAYSWIDPSLVGTSALGHSSPDGEGMRSLQPGVASSLLQGPLSPVGTHAPPPVRGRRHERSQLMNRIPIDRYYIHFNLTICS